MEEEKLEILDETPVKAEEPELKSLRRRCHELEQFSLSHHEPFHLNVNRPVPTY